MIKKATLTLPDGDYRLRVTGNGRLGRTPRFAVNRGETIAHQLSLDEGRLLGREKIDRFSVLEPGSRDQPIPYAPMTAALELKPGTVDFIESTSTSLIRRNAVNGNVIWDAVGSHRAWQPGRDPSTWLQLLPGRPRVAFSRETGPRPGWRRHRRPRLGVLVRPLDLRAVGCGRVAALDLPRRARRSRRPIARDARAHRPGRASCPAGPRPWRARAGRRRSRRHSRPDRHDEVRRISRGAGTPRGGRGPPRAGPGPETSRPYAGSSPSRDDRADGCGVARSIARSRLTRSHPGTGRRRSCGVVHRRWWRSSRAPSGSASTRRPAGRSPARSTWASFPCDRSRMPTSMATARPRSWPSGLDRQPASRCCRHSRPARASNRGP